ncbi:hypothetical protein P7C71_g5176, partial [Lecanoromycetidae sp. Uapishka_2]
MNVIRSWQGRGTLPVEKRKRPTAEEFFDGKDPRKRSKADRDRDRDKREEEANEYKIRGTAGTENATDTARGGKLPHSSSSSYQLKQPKPLRVDTTRAVDDLDPPSPAFTPAMAGEPLRDTLDNFAQSIQSSASLTTQQDFKAHQLTAHDKDRQRQQRHGSIYTTLAEDAETKFDALENSSVALKRQAEQVSSLRASTLSQLAGRMETVGEQVVAPSGNSAGQSRNEKAVREQLTQLEDKLAAAQTDIVALRQQAVFRDDLDQVVHKSDLEQVLHKSDLEPVVTQDDLQRSLRAVAHKDDLRRLVDKDDLDRYMTKYALDPMKSKLYEQKVNIEGQFTDCKTDVSRLAKRITDAVLLTEGRNQEGKETQARNAKLFEDLTARFSETQTKLSEIGKTTADQDEGLTNLREGINRHESSLAEITAFVRGDGGGDGKPSLEKVVDAKSKKLLDIQESIGHLRSTTRELTERLDGVATRVDQTATQSHSEPESHLGLDFQELRDEFVAFRKDQKNVDDCVSSDCETLEKKLNEQTQNITLLSDELQRTKVEMGKQWSHSLGLITASRPTQPPTPPQQARPFTPLEPDRFKLQELSNTIEALKDQTKALEIVSSAQQQKFEAQKHDVVDNFLKRSLEPWRKEADKSFGALNVAYNQLIKANDNKDVELKRLTTEMFNHYSSLRARFTTLEKDIDLEKALDPSHKAHDRKAREVVNDHSGRIEELSKRVDRHAVNLSQKVEKNAKDIALVTSTTQSLENRVEDLARASKGHYLEKDLLHPASESDRGIPDDSATIHNLRNTDLLEYVDEDSDAPLRGRNRQSHRDTRGESSEGGPRSSRGDRGNDTTLSPLLKRKRQSDTLSPQDDDLVTRRANGKGYRIREQ